jgi:outer membrane protein assembly factor BamB
MTRKRVLLVVGGIVAVILAGTAAFLGWAVLRSPPQGGLEAATDVTLETVDTAPPVKVAQPPPKTEPQPEQPCWDAFGGGPRRELSRGDIYLGVPGRSTWARGLGDLIEFPPVYCDGRLYVNLERGKTLALDATTGKTLWSRRAIGLTPSSPAIAGDLLFVTSKGGSITALRRQDGSLVWQLRPGAPVESSPVVVDDVVYVAVSDGRLFALGARTGKPRWVYNLHGKINSSPSVVGANVCITTYAGAVGCFRRNTGEKVWLRYFKRDFVRYDSFYASASSDGRRLYTASRGGRVLALDAATGDTIWEVHTGGWTYGTPAVSGGRIFVADLDRTIRAFRAADGALLWSRPTGGRVLAPALVVGNLVFYSTLEGRTVALWAPTGVERWHHRSGAYAPGIATRGHYYLSLNGVLAAFEGSLQRRR